VEAHVDETAHSLCKGGSERTIRQSEQSTIAVDRIQSYSFRIVYTLSAPNFRSTQMSYLSDCTTVLNAPRFRSVHEYWTPLSQRGTSEEGEGPGGQGFRAPTSVNNFSSVLTLQRTEQKTENSQESDRATERPTGVALCYRHDIAVFNVRPGNVLCLWLLGFAALPCRAQVDTYLSQCRIDPWSP